MSDISQNILVEIKKRNIAPRPRWEFLVKNNIFWAIFGVFVAMGGVAVSVAIFMLTDQDWDIYQYLNKSFAEYVFLSIPYFWFLMVLAFMTFAWLDFRQTKSGYKYSFLRIGVLNIVSSLILGTIFFYSGLGLKIESVFADNIPFYKTIHPLRSANIWESPEKGLLVGEIINFINDEDFNLRDPMSREWIIDCVDCIWVMGAEGKEGMVVKVIGKKVDDSTFQAFEMRIGRPGLGPRKPSPQIMKNGNIIKKQQQEEIQRQMQNGNR